MPKRTGYYSIHLAFQQEIDPILSLPTPEKREAVSDETAAWAFPAAQGHLLRTWLSAGSEVTLPVAAGSSGLVQTNLPGNAFREMLHKSCFQLSGNSWILVLRGSIEQAQVERNGLFQWADYGTRN